MVLNFGPMPKKGWDMKHDASRSMQMGKWATRPIFAPSDLCPQRAMQSYSVGGGEIPVDQERKVK